MNRRSLLCGAALLGAHGAIPQVRNARADQRSQNQLRIVRATTAALALQRRDWEQGILAQAMLEANDRANVILLTRAAMVQQTRDGRMAVVVAGGPTDPAMGGEAYARAGEWTSDPAVQQAVKRLLQWIRKEAPRNADGILYHVFAASEMWADGFNCAPPFLAAMGFYDEALVQIEGYRKRLWNPEKKLLSHIWDDGGQQLKDKNFWGGGNGWAAAGLARVIRQLPRERGQDRERLAAFVKDIVDGCLAYQRSDGLFHDVVDQPATFPETNLAQMLAFAIYEGVSSGWLAETYLNQAHRMRNAARRKVDGSGYVQGVCGAPNFDRPGISTEGQAFCILMESASNHVTMHGVRGA